jgi:hypothetical protein
MPWCCQHLPARKQTVLNAESAKGWFDLACHRELRPNEASRPATRPAHCRRSNWHRGRDRWRSGSPGRASVPTCSRNFRQATRIARRLAAKSELLSSLPNSSLRQRRIFRTDWTQCVGISSWPGSESTRRSSRNDQAAGSVDLQLGRSLWRSAQGVEMPVSLFAIS